MFYLERLPCPVLVTDLNGQVLHCNHDFKRLAATSDCKGSMDRYFPPSARIFLQTHAWPLLYRNGEFSELYLQLLSSDQQPLPVMTNARISDADGQRVVIWLFFVAKERQRFEAELLSARQQAQQSAARLSEVNIELQNAYARLAQYTVEVKSEAEQLAQLSYTDALTGLGNRRALQMQIERWIGHAEPFRTGSLLLIDIDFFKQVNDRFGHAEGDRILSEVAAQLQHSVRQQDCVIRQGGEEFAIWLPSTDADGASLTARRVHQQVARVLAGDQPISVSIGCTTRAPAAQDAASYLERLLAEADIALYAAKHSGRQCTQCFADLHAQNAAHRLSD